MADGVGLILAAGESTRLRTALPKPLHRVCGRALLEYALDAAADLAAVAVLAPADAAPLAALCGERARCIPGEPSLSDGITRALAELPDRGPLLLIPADLPQLEARHLQALLEAHHATGAEATTLIVGGMPTGVFAVRRAAVARLETAATPDTLFPAAGRCELPGEPLIDVNTRRDLARAEKALRRGVVERLMDEGVTFLDPDNTFVDAWVRVGRDTILYPWTLLEGATEIGERCVIGPHSHLIDCTLEEDVAVEAVLMRDSHLGRGVRVGPFAHLRPGSRVGEGTKIGDFVELKNARLGAHVSVAHLAYLGDAEVGDHVNIGAGVITCNYDGVRKHETHIGAGAFIGSNSVLLAPVSIGAGAYVAAHSAINQDVPGDALAIARARQENKPEWARRRRESQKKD